MKSKRIFNLIALILVMSLAFNSCEEQDESIIQTQEAENQYKLIKLKPNEYKLNQKLNEKISSIQKDDKITKKGGHEIPNKKKLELNLNEATYIENLDGTYHSYTFAIKDENNSSNIRNIILSSQPDSEEYKAFLITYSLTKEERIKIDNDGKLNLKDKMTIKPFDINKINITKSGSTCYEFEKTGEEPCACHAQHAPGGCTHPDDVFEWVEVPCNEGGGSNGSGNPNNNPDIGSGGTSGNGGTGTGGNGGATSLTNPNGSTIQIINNLNDKAKCIYGNLNAFSADFAEAIKKFDGDFPVSHLKLESVALSGTSRGRTIPPSNGVLDVNSPAYVITIQINSADNINGSGQRPNLMVAKTIAHEVLHAEMFRKLLSLAKQGHLDFTGWTAQQQTDYMISIKENFPGIYDYFRRHKDWQHAQMATHYRETLARILQEFDTSTAVPDNEQPDQLYMDLAWEGLRYPSIHTWSSLSQTEKDRIEGVIDDYINDNKNETCSE